MLREQEDNLRDRLSIALGQAYVVERELGGGGMARVFLATEPRLGRRVVVKVLSHGQGPGMSASRFEREIRLAARLQHPHLLPLLNAGEIDGLPFYTTPFVEGETLRARLQRYGALPVADVIRFLREIADGLAYAHARGIVHRDLKPDNVLLSGDHAVVCDFGVAKAKSAAIARAWPDAPSATSSLGDTTALGVVLGTPAYMAPEQAAGDPSTDHRADLYALGLVAYELLTGHHPFAGRPSTAMIAAHIAETPEPIGSQRPDVPPALAGLVMQLLAKEPVERPQTAIDVIRRLDEIALTVPRMRGSSYLRRHRLGIGAGVIVVLLSTYAVLLLARRTAATASGTTGDTPLIDRRVAVTSLEDRTGTKALASLGQLASDWISQGLTEAGFAEVVDPQIVEMAQRSTPARAGLAAATRARYIVSGASYVEGDSVRLLARIVDATDDRLVSGLGPVSAPLGSPQLAVVALRERVLAAIAGLLDARSGGWAAASGLPPNLAAYQRWSAGVEHFFQDDFYAAALEFREATRIDSTFVAPLIWSAAAYMNAGSESVADSLLEAANRRRDRLTPTNRALLDVKLAEIRGDWDAAVRAGREMVRVTPGSQLALTVLGWDAWRGMRPKEAIAALRRIQPELVRVQQYAPYWDVLTQSYHALGDYRNELAAARQGRAQFPDRLTIMEDEARSLAELGRSDDVLRLLNDVAARRAEPSMTPGSTMRRIGLELRAHGQRAAADTAFARALRWYEELPLTVQRTRPTRTQIAIALYAAGRWDDAQRMFARLAADAPDDLDHVGYLGALAARRHDTSAARRADSLLMSVRQPYVFGRPTYWRARIAALGGDRERAVALLRQALEEGRGYWLIHPEPDFDGLRDLPAFQKLVRLKD